MFEYFVSLQLHVARSLFDGDENNDTRYWSLPIRLYGINFNSNYNFQTDVTQIAWFSAFLEIRTTKNPL